MPSQPPLVPMSQGRKRRRMATRRRPGGARARRLVRSRMRAPLALPRTRGPSTCSRSRRGSRTLAFSISSEFDRKFTLNNYTLNKAFSPKLIYLIKMLPKYLLYDVIYDDLECSDAVESETVYTFIIVCIIVSEFEDYLLDMCGSGGSVH